LDVQDVQEYFLMRGYWAGPSAVLVLAAALSRVWGAVDTVSITATVNGAPTPGQLVDIHYTGSLGSSSFSEAEVAYAGQTNWNRAVGTDSTGTLLTLMPLSFANSGTFTSYCIDVTQNIFVGGSFTYTGLTNSFLTEPIISPSSGYTGMGATAAQAVENLFANEYFAVTMGGTAIQYDANPNDTDSSASDQSAAFQIALWDVIYGINSAPSSIDVTSSSNGFWVSNYHSLASFNEIAGMADLFAEAALNGSDQTFDGTLLAMTSPTLPDQLLAIFPSDSQAPALPEPAPLMLGVPLLMKLAMGRRARQRLVSH
jgi:hypothetical protein